uniref:Ras-GEF domain-containing protein n=1 Tax=Mustela putorius furo TaxID=9669 RepID=M3YH21_MUSPF
EPTATPEASSQHKNELKEKKADLLDFPPKLVGEQLTYMDAELFKKVVLHQCLGSIWSQRNRPGNEHLAPTVRAAIAQFNAVASCIVPTCFGNPSMTARDRAVVVDHYFIQGGAVCQILGNYSSLHAILVALQSVSIHCLKRTWDNVSRKNFQTFKNLCREDNPPGRELPIKLSQFYKSLQRRQPPGQKVQKRLPKKGVVPYIVTFLIDLVMLETAKGNEINHSKNNKDQEYRVLTDIMLLQAAAGNYCLEP